MPPGEEDNPQVEAVQHVDPERFRSSSAGRLLRVGRGKTAYWAFVPNPLPPSLDFDVGLGAALSEADRALGELAGLGRTIANPHLLIRPFVRREAVLSSRIEGTRAEISDLYAYELEQQSFPGLESSASEPDVREVFNYVRALEYGLDRLSTLPVSLRLMRELHKRLMEGVRGERATPGEFRRRQNWIGGPGCAIEDAEFVPPPVEQMHRALGDLEKYVHGGNELPPLVRLALIHYQFEAIHPFLDGNGRIGRLLISLLLVGWDLLPQPLLYLSAFFERRRQDYYDLLLAISERGAWRDWLLFFLEGVAEQSCEAIGRARRLQDLQREFHQRVRQRRASQLLSDLIDGLFERPIISIPQAQQMLNVSYPTAQQHVNKLMDVGVLRYAGQTTRGRFYVAEEILQAIQQ